MSSSSMLEEAIVDAKALKDAAIKNAESMVVEKYADQIKEAVASLLEAEEPLPDTEEESLESYVGGEEELPTTEADPIFDEIPAASEPPSDEVPDDSEVIVLNLTDIEQRLADMGAGEHSDLADDLAEPEAPAFEQPADAGDELPPAHIDPDLEQPPADEPMLEESAEEAEDEEIELDEEVVKEAIASVFEALEIDVDEQTLRDGWMSTPASVEEQADDLVIAKEADDAVAEENEALRDRVKELEEAIKKNKASLEEYKAAVSSLKNTVSEVNTSNAKLLYINKTLGNLSLNERQKRKIVEAISKATTNKEAKVIYETLQGSMGSVVKSTTAPKSLNEAVSRAPSLTVKPRETVKKTDVFAERMRRLAGIK